MKKDFGNIITAMITPFDNNEHLDLASVSKIVSHLEDTGTETLVLGGTTGEGPTLTEDEKMLLLKEVIKCKSPSTKIIMNVGTNNTRETIKNAVKWSSLDEIGAIMVVCPYYNKPSQEGLFLHFQAVNNSTRKPIMVYHIPGRTNVKMSEETMIRVARLSNVTMLKDAEGDLEKLRYVISKTSNDWDVYSGDDPAIFDYLEIGAKGVVSVASHINGEEMVKLFSSYKEGAKVVSREFQTKIKQSSELLFPVFSPNPVPVKYLLKEMLGLAEETVRLPLTVLSEEEKKMIKLGYLDISSMYS